MVEYKMIDEAVDYPKKAITEDGHTMFLEDVLTRLKRLNYLENWKTKLERGKK